MKRKGFTLIEVLAVIVLLGIIMLTVVPNILKTFNNSKENTFKINLEKLYDATEVYKNEYELLYGRVLRNTTLEIVNNKIEGNPLSLKGKLPKSGSILIDELGQISLVAYDNGFCGEKLYNDPEVTVSKLSEDECQLYNVKDYEIVAKDFGVLQGSEVNILDYAQFGRYNQIIDDVEMTYTSNPTFDINVFGDYEVTYQVNYKEKEYSKTIKVTVAEKDVESPVLTVNNVSGYYKTSANLSITVSDRFSLSEENIYQYYVSDSNTELLNGEWLTYVNNKSFEITGTNQTKYLWVYAIKDTSDNVSDNKTFKEPYVIGSYVFDSAKPEITSEIEIETITATITLNVVDVGGSGLAANNRYQYYVSTSNTNLRGGSWKEYTNGESFEVSEKGRYYIWVYPVYDNSGNISHSELVNNAYIVGEFAIDSINPVLTLDSASMNSTGAMTLYATDEGGSGLSEENVYKYYLSTSATELIGGTWKEYTNGGSFTTSNSDYYYLWVYPIKDKAGNVNENRIFGEPYVMKKIFFCSNTPEYTYYKPNTTTPANHQFIDDSNGNWRIKFLESGTFTLTKTLCTDIDIFLVGGGGGGGLYGDDYYAGGGGGGGRTFAKNAIPVTPNIKYNITIGAPGVGSNSIYSRNGTSGGTTSAFGYTAIGGDGGGGWSAGGAGGSGGGTGKSGGAGGSNGSAGTYGAASGGVGQGRTTCEFELMNSNGTCHYTDNNYSGLYAGGGGGGGTGSPGGAGGKGGGGNGGNGQTGGLCTTGKTNTGGGGGGGSAAAFTRGCDGGSGIVVIKNSAHYSIGEIVYKYTGHSEIIDDGDGNWRIRFLTSGKLEFIQLPSTTTIDVFLVGGGGGGGLYGDDYYAGGGGGGGYTLVQNKVSIKQNNEYEIVVGKHGLGSTSIYSRNGTAGEATTAFGYSIAGGSGGSGWSNGGNGGSGGGTGKSSGTGGSNGSAGGSEYVNGGTGQGRTTCEFELINSNGTCYYTDNGYSGLYSGGGGGGGTGRAGGSGGGGGGGRGGNGETGSLCTNGVVNTGGGGGGGSAATFTRGCDGGDGIVIIRNSR